MTEQEEALRQMLEEARELRGVIQRAFTSIDLITETIRCILSDTGPEAGGLSGHEVYMLEETLEEYSTGEHKIVDYKDLRATGPTLG